MRQTPFPQALLNHPRNRAQRLLLMTRYLSMVEMETSTFCNRRCYFCPNATLQQNHTQKLMANALYIKILTQLREIEYNQIITYSRYNEPLANKNIFENIRTARSYLPYARLHISTNGDYLNLEVLEQLRKCGLNSLRVGCYFKQPGSFSMSRAQKMCDAVQERLHPLGICFNQETFIDGHYVERQAHFGSLAIGVYSRNFDVNATSRGHTVNINKQYQRPISCDVPFRHLYIHWNGDVMLCCNVRNDVAEHAPYIFGNANKSELNKLFFSQVSLRYRRMLDAATIPTFRPCNTCNFNIPFTRGTDNTHDNEIWQSCFLNRELLKAINEGFKLGARSCMLLAEKADRPFLENILRMTGFSILKDSPVSKRASTSLSPDICFTTIPDNKIKAISQKLERRYSHPVPVFSMIDQGWLQHDNEMVYGLLQLLALVHQRGIKRIALYGAGLHTRRLLPYLMIMPLVITAIIDDNPTTKCLLKIPVVSRETFDFSCIDGIIISSDHFEKDMVKRLHASGIDDNIIFPIYSEIPSKGESKSELNKNRIIKRNG